MNTSAMQIAKASVEVATTLSRSEEEEVIKKLKVSGISSVAVDVGGNLIDSIPKILERALVASKRTGLIQESHVYDGAVVGAAREAIMQVVSKANGLNVGGKIGIARGGEHLSICIFMSIGLLHLNEVVIGLAHRSIPEHL